MKKLHLTIFLLLIWGFSFAQQYTNYNAKNGLPSNHVYRITQDINGFIWFITDKGMVKFNGSEFKTFTIRDGLPTNDIWNIAATPNGNVWYFSKASKVGYIKHDSIYAFSSEKQDEILHPMNRDILGNNIAFSNSIDYFYLENNVWKKRSTYGGFSELKQYRTFLKHPKLDRFQFSKDKKHLLFIDKKNKNIKTTTMPKSIALAYTRSQINDSTYIWLSDVGYTVLNLNTYAVKSQLFKNQIDINKSKYVRLHIVNNQVQITGEGFVSVLDNNYNLIKTHYIPKHLKAHFSFIDKQNNLWMATFTNGVYKLPVSKKNAVYTLTDDKVGKIKKIGNDILTTVLNKGFYKYDSITKQFTPFIKESDYSYGVYDIKALGKHYFITTKKIISLKKGLKNQTFFNETARQLVYHKGYLYGNYTLRLNKLNSEDLSIEKTYLYNGIKTFISFKDTLLIATSNGLKVLKKDSIVSLKFKTKKPHLIQKTPILNLTKLSKNWLLVGTDSYGAFITNLDTIIPLKETNYLSINDAFVEKNDLWLATDNGVLYYQKDSTNNYRYNTSYTEADGLLLKNIKSVYATYNDLIITSNSGVVTIPKKKQKNSQLLGIYVNELKYNNKIATSNNFTYTNNNTVNVTIERIDFSENKTPSIYKYQLSPIHEEWISTTSKHISFSNLQPNKYQLKIKSNDKENSVAFTIIPLWYQTSVFKALFLIFGIITLLFLIKWNRKIVEQKTKEKLAIKQQMVERELYALRSQMNPHFVFNSLAAIQYYIFKNDYESSEQYLVKFSQLIRRFFELSKEKEITLQEEINLLKNYLEIEKLRFKEKLSFTFNIDKNLALDSVKIPTMLLQPIVENAVNHGVFNKLENGLVTINFKKLSTNSYQVEIIDDGVGFENTVKKKFNKKSSSMVLQDRLRYLNEHQNRKIVYITQVLDATKKDKGNISKFTITHS